MRYSTCLLMMGAAFALLCKAPAHAHELQSNRLSLVLREPGHLSLNFHLDYAELMRRTVAPQVSPPEFAIRMAAATAAQWDEVLGRTQSRLMRGTQLGRPDGTALQPGTWRWPTLEQVQALMQRLAMAAVVAPYEHAHEDPLEVQAEVLVAESLRELALQLPAELQEVLVVNYRPRQRWLAPGAPPSPIVFD